MFEFIKMNSEVGRRTRRSDEEVNVRELGPWRDNFRV
jgi:hypothetical protein